MTRLDDRVLALSATLVDRAVRNGWRDRNAILRDLSLMQVATCILWTASTATLSIDPSSIMLLAPVAVGAISAWQAWRSHSSIGSENSRMGHGEAVSSAFRYRHTRRGSRMFDLFTIALFCVVPAIGILAWAAVPGIRLPYELLCPPAFFAFEAGRDYVRATDPPALRATSEVA